MKTAYVILIISIVFVSYEFFSEEKGPEFKKWANISKQSDWYKKLSEEVGMNFSKDIQLLNHNDGGGRLDGYYEWLISSSFIFQLPKMNQPGVDKYIEMPIANSIKVIESRLERQKLSDVKRSYLSEWKKGDYLFKGHVVTTSVNNYLLIERYKE